MINIEFRYYNKTSCERCASTDKSVKLSLKELKNVIKKADVDVKFKETKLPKNKIHLSPFEVINF